MKIGGTIHAKNIRAHRFKVVMIYFVFFPHGQYVAMRLQVSARMHMFVA